MFKIVRVAYFAMTINETLRVPLEFTFLTYTKKVSNLEVPL